jgi:uncharacterized membrane protein
MDDHGAAVKVEQAERAGSYRDAAGHVLESGHAILIGLEIGHVTHMIWMVVVWLRIAERAGIIMSPGGGEARGNASPDLMKVKPVLGVRRQAFYPGNDQHLRRDSLPRLEELDLS